MLTGVLHALLLSWPDDRSLASLIDDDAQWLALLTLVAARFLRVDESPDRAGAREPSYKRLLSVELSRLLRAERDAMRASTVRVGIVAAVNAAVAVDEQTSTSATTTLTTLTTPSTTSHALAATLRQSSPLTCQLLDECLAREFWVYATPDSQSEPSFGLATWILTMIANVPGLAALPYAGPIVDMFVKLLQRPALAALKNQRSQVDASD